MNTNSYHSVAEKQPLIKQFTESILAERERWVLWLPVLLGIGIGVYFALPNEPVYGTGGALLSLCLIAGFTGRRSVTWLFFVAGLATIALGLAIAQWRSHQVTAPILQKKTHAVSVQGHVTDIDRLENATRLTVSDVTIGDMRADKTPKKIRIRLPQKYAIPKIGDEVTVRAVLNPPSPPTAPDAFDFRRYAYFKQLGGMGYAVSKVKVTKPNNKTGWRLHFENWRQIVSDRITIVMEKDTAAVAMALLTGERNSISEQWWDKIRTSGIAHLLAISGLHIGLVAGFAFFVVRAILASFERITLRYPIKKIAAGVSFLCALFYMVLVGAPVSSQRALLMTGIVLLAIILDREALSLRLAAFAAMVVLLCAPESLMGASFQLSFAAVVSLIAFYESTRSFWRQFYHKSWVTRAGVYLLACLMTTIISSLATAPYALFHFQRLDFIPGLLANMVAIPLTVFLIMPMGMLALLVMPLGLESGFLQIMEYGVWGILHVVDYASGIPWGVWEMPSLSMAFLIWMTLGGVWLCLWQGRIRWLGIIGIVIGVITAPQPQPDILISENGELTAIRQQDGTLLFSTLRAEKFTRQSWQRRDGHEHTKMAEVQSFPDQGVSLDGNLRCDDLACIYNRSGQVISVIRDPMALAMECQNKDIDMIISPIPIKDRKCHPHYIIDKFDLWRGGAHAVYIHDNGRFEIQTTKQQGQKRLWHND